jgi:hypothetical protein
LGGVSFLDRGVRFPQFNLPVNGEAVITADGDGLVIYFPAKWYGEEIITRRLTHPALFTQVLREDEIYELTFTGERNISLAVEPLFTTAAFAYDFILRDRRGFAVDHGENAGDRIHLQPHRPLTVTPHMDAELFFPHTLLRDLRITSGTDTPAYYSLGAGKSLMVTNADPLHSHNIFLASEPSGYAVIYDYVLETGEGLSFGIRRDAGTVRIPPGGILTLTAGQPPDWAPQEITVRFPVNDVITLNTATSAIERYTLDAGESLLMANTGKEELLVLVRPLEAEMNPEPLHFVLYNEQGEIYRFGRSQANTEIILESGYRIHLTNPEGNDPMGLYFPVAWRDVGLITEETDEPALYRRALEPGEALRFDNVNTRFNRDLRIESASDTEPARYEYVLTDNRGAILSYGLHGGMFNQRYNSRLTLMTRGNTRIYVSFPAVWHTRDIRIVAANEPPLHEIILQPGERLTLRNTTSTEITFSNNSAPGRAGYFFRTESGPTPIYHGPITLEPNATIHLVAASGEYLHIWMPMTRARQLRLI